MMTITMNTNDLSTLSGAELAFAKWILDEAPDDRLVSGGSIDDDASGVRSRFNPSDVVQKIEHGSYKITPADRARAVWFCGGMSNATTRGVRTHHKVEAERREDGVFVVRVPGLPLDVETLEIPFTILAAP